MLKYQHTGCKPSKDDSEMTDINADVSLLTVQRYTAADAAEGDWYLDNILRDDQLLQSALTRHGISSVRIDTVKFHKQHAHCFSSNSRPPFFSRSFMRRRNFNHNLAWSARGVSVSSSWLDNKKRSCSSRVGGFSGVGSG